MVNLYIKKKSLSTLVDFLSAVFLFVHFIVYPIAFHLAYDLNQIESLRIGYIEIGLLLLLSIPLAKAISSLLHDNIGRLAIAILIFIQINAVTQLLFMGTIENKWNWYYSNTFLILIIFLLGYRCFPLIERYRKALRIISFTLVVLVPILLLVLQQQSSAFLNRLGGSSVLSIADNIMYLGLFMIISTNKGIARLFAISFPFISLWIMGSRGALFSFVVISAVYLVTMSNRRTSAPMRNLRSSMATNMILVAIIGISAFVLLDPGNGGKSAFKPLYLQYNRMRPAIISAATNIREDSSFKERMSLLESGIRIIEKHPIVGEYMNEFIYQDRGAYVHNILSYGAEYGLIVLSLFVALILIVLQRAWKKSIERGKDDFVLIYLAASFFMLCTSRFYGYSHIWLALGLALALISNRNK
ncbi:MAG TPA: hypothetical protein PLP54_12710 [Candidatus Aminicenantes bacterium]|nr:hypothetical protein [Candidatus Aminicenantes bacterium]HRZ72660.1 hypothetical protein [Candidatus Aminicenantes bacterium]